MLHMCKEECTSSFTTTEELMAPPLASDVMSRADSEETEVIVARWRKINFRCDARERAGLLCGGLQKLLLSPPV